MASESLVGEGSCIGRRGSSDEHTSWQPPLSEMKGTLVSKLLKMAVPLFLAALSLSAVIAVTPASAKTACNEGVEHVGSKNYKMCAGGKVVGSGGLPSAGFSGSLASGSALSLGLPSNLGIGAKVSCTALEASGVFDVESGKPVQADSVIPVFTGCSLQGEPAMVNNCQLSATQLTFTGTERGTITPNIETLLLKPTAGETVVVVKVVARPGKSCGSGVGEYIFLGQYECKSPEMRAETVSHEYACEGKLREREISLPISYREILTLKGASLGKVFGLYEA